MWQVEPDGPATWLGSLKLHPAAIPISGLAVGPNGAVRHRWLVGGFVSSREGNTPPWTTPAFQAGPSGIGVWGVGRREASREISKHGNYFRLKR